MGGVGEGSGGSRFSDISRVSALAEDRAAMLWVSPTYGFQVPRATLGTYRSSMGPGYRIVFPCSAD